MNLGHFIHKSICLSIKFTEKHESIFNYQFLFCELFPCNQRRKWICQFNDGRLFNILLEYRRIYVKMPTAMSRLKQIQTFHRTYRHIFESALWQISFCLCWPTQLTHANTTAESKTKRIIYSSINYAIHRIGINYRNVNVHANTDNSI